MPKSVKLASSFFCGARPACSLIPDANPTAISNGHYPKGRRNEGGRESFTKVKVLAFVEPIVAICVALGFALCAAPAINAGIGGYFMAAVPTELLGRATSASALMSMGALPLAPLIAGFGFPLWGWTGLQILCASITTFACILAIKNKPLRTIPKSVDWAQRAAAYAV